MQLSTVTTYCKMIKFSHTIFALPFALSSAVLVHPVKPLNLTTLCWIILAMASARSAAMGFNRLADVDIDAANPRTSGRELPQGTISRTHAAYFVVISSGVFIASAALLSPLCFWLSFPVLALLFGYSYTKRFTWLSHIVLGLAIGIAPIAVWIAVSGGFSWRIGVLSLALLTYIAGFDILYACQDVEFDRGAGLYSIPKRFGVGRAMRISEFIHLASVSLLGSLFWLFSMHWIYLVFVAVIAVLFTVEHRLINKDDLSKIDIAFYQVNSAISLLVFAAIVTESLVRDVF